MRGGSTSFDKIDFGQIQNNIYLNVYIPRTKIYNAKAQGESHLFQIFSGRGEYFRAWNGSKEGGEGLQGGTQRAIFHVCSR